MVYLLAFFLLFTVIDSYIVRISDHGLIADSAITEFTRPKGQKTFEKEPDFVPIANKSRAPARAMTEPILKQNLPRIEQDFPNGHNDLAENS